MDTQRLILFIVFSFSILMLWDAWQKEQHPAPVAQIVNKNAGIDQAPAPTVRAVDAPAKDSGPLQTGERVKIQTDLVYAEIDTLGGDVRRLELLKHRDTQDKSKKFVLLEDDPKYLYIAQSGLIGHDLPTHKSLFTSASTHYQLAEGSNELSVRLTWIGANGIKVDKVFTFRKDSYVVDVTYEIHNGSTLRMEPHSYFQLVRNGRPPVGDSMFITTYTGPAVYTDKEKFQKIAFSDIEENKASYPKHSNDGWVAMIQLYFLSAWLPSNDQPREYYAKKVGDDLYNVGVVLPVGSIEPGITKKITVPLFAGPQEQDHLSKVAPGLDLVVDYGILTVISAPLFWVLAWLNKLVQNWGVAIILLTVLIKLVFYPLSAKSYRSMAQMRVLGPKLQKLKEQYGDDRQRMHTAMMELYKTEKVNPLGGCLPVVVQIPVFIALYWALLNSVEMRQAPFMLWINDLSAPDPYYILPIVMGLTMIIQTRLNPTPPDPIQAKIMMIMPIAFSVFFFFFPAGLVLYWVVNNVLSIAQQWYVTHGVEQEKAVAKGHVKR